MTTEVSGRESGVGDGVQRILALCQVSGTSYPLFARNLEIYRRKPAMLTVGMSELSRFRLSCELFTNLFSLSDVSSNSWSDNDVIDQIMASFDLVQFEWIDNASKDQNIS